MKIQQNTMYTADEVIDCLQETRGVPGEVIAHAGRTVTREYSAYWEMGQGKAHKTGYVKWAEVETLDDSGELDQAERTVIEFAED